MNGKLSLNSIILDLRIRNSHLNEDGHYGDFFMNLWELLCLPDVLLLEMVKDRIVIVGDFTEHDMHETVLGNMAGPLILLNAYLSLVNEENIVSLPFLLTLFAAYLLISWRIISGRSLEERRWGIRMLRSVIRGRLITKLVNWLLILAALSAGLYVVFNIHINILLIAADLTALEWGVRHAREKRKARCQADLDMFTFA